MRELKSYFTVFYLPLMYHVNIIILYQYGIETKE